VDFIVDDGVVLPATMRTRLRREVARMVRAAALTDGVDYEMSLRLTTDEVIRELNREYRHKDKPTDVLAFAQREAPGAPRDILGDVVISIDAARRQARRGLYAELLMLASHGLCHLLGYDHQDDEQEAAMNARMSALRKESARQGRVRAA